MLKTRMWSQLLTSPRFDDPADIVTWMGAMQGQDHRMVKWAIGLRMTVPSLKRVQEAIDRGTILRTHIMRPTWHIVPARDIKWMLSLSSWGAKSVNRVLVNYFGIDEAGYKAKRGAIEKILTGRHLTKHEIAEELSRGGTVTDADTVQRYLTLAEAEGVVCSGADRGGKHSYALLDERVPDAVRMGYEESCAELARRYFRSHSPATLEDFVWWSGLGVRDARRAIASLGAEIFSDIYLGREVFIYDHQPSAIISGIGEAAQGAATVSGTANNPNPTSAVNRTEKEGAVTPSGTGAEGMSSLSRPITPGQGAVARATRRTLSADKPDEPVMHLLPPFDEYLISYKDRSDCIRPEHMPLAYNNFGIFRPVVLHNGRITGGWKNNPKKDYEIFFYEGCRAPAKTLLQKAAKRYELFRNS